jgi:D-lyxose ketol-isomerase
MNFMKRSEINAIIDSAVEFIGSRGFYLPPFAYWTPNDWTMKGPDVHEIVENKLGWDITDFGRGEFNSYGLILFTIRNGRLSPDQTVKGKGYAEKIMIVGDGQVTPLHFHWSKMEDIINRGGGDLLIQLFRSTQGEQLDEAQPVQVSVDGQRRIVEAGATLLLAPGESITLEQGCYHKFWSRGRTLVGEVSQVNDDLRDNRFFETIGRFPEIEEDVPPQHLLCSDYPRYYQWN